MSNIHIDILLILQSKCDYPVRLPMDKIKNVSQGFRWTVESPPNRLYKLRGCTGHMPTFHENMMMLMYPDLEYRVSFGTGPNGLKKYGTTRYVVDFYDAKRKQIIEIDGPDHMKSVSKIIKDYKRDLFFEEDRCIKTLRYDHLVVEEIMLCQLQHMERTLSLDFKTAIKIPTAEGRLNIAN